MKRWLFHHFLVVFVVFSTVMFAGCGGLSINPSTILTSPATQDLGDAAFRVIDLVLNSEDIFAIAKDTFLLSKDAINLVTTINANQTPPVTTKAGHIQVSILYNKRGVESQDVYDIKTGRPALESSLKVEPLSSHFREIALILMPHTPIKLPLCPCKMQRVTSPFQRMGDGRIQEFS